MIEEINLKSTILFIVNIITMIMMHFSKYFPFQVEIIIVASCAVIVLLSAMIDSNEIKRHPVRIGINFIRAIVCMFIIIGSFGKVYLWKNILLSGMYHGSKKVLFVATVLDFIVQVLQKIKSYLQEFRNYY